MIIKEASTSKKIRNIASENPVATAKQFYDEAAHGGIQHNIYDGKGNIKGYVTKLKDGTTTATSSSVVSMTEGLLGRKLLRQLLFILT